LRVQGATDLDVFNNLNGVIHNCWPYLNAASIP